MKAKGKKFAAPTPAQQMHWRRGFVNRCQESAESGRLMSTKQDAVLDRIGVEREITGDRRFASWLAGATAEQVERFKLSQQSRPRAVLDKKGAK